MITKIAIQNTATYDAEGVTIDNLKKINFFYGANGSGKTTISNVLQSPSEYETCTIEWQDDTPMDTLVYNKKFRDHNFGNTKIAGVFTLGKATKEQIENIEAKKAKLEEIEKLGKQKNETIATLEKEKKTSHEAFKDLCWEQIRLKNDAFKEAFRGFLNDKNKFAGKVIDEYRNNTSTLIPLEDLQEKAKALFSPVPTPLVSIQAEEVDINTLTSIENNDVWKKKIIGKSDIDIAPLIQKLNNADWLNQGRQYIQEETDICPFCQQKTIDNKFKKNIEAFFDESYTRNIGKIKELSAKYRTICDNYINILNNVYKVESQNEQSKLDTTIFKAYVDTLDQQFRNNNEHIEIKEKEPSRSITLNATEEQIQKIQQQINEANIKITAHNKLVENFQTEKK